MLDYLANANKVACNSWLDISPYRLSIQSLAGSWHPIKGSSNLLAVSSTTPSPNSSTGSKGVRCWFLACKVVKGHSTDMAVDSLGGLG